MDYLLQLRGKVGMLLLCLLVAGACYLSALSNELVLDDVPVVGANPAIRSITPLQFLKSPYWLTNDNPGIYRPLTVFSLSLDYALWHQWIPGFRLTNILLHGLNGWLLFLLVGTFVESWTIPRAAALIYLLHPVHTEAVVTIVGRSELLAALFFITAWLCYRTCRTALVAPAFLASLLCKENAIMLPAVLALDTYLSQGGNLRSVLSAWKTLLAVALTAVFYTCLRFVVLGGLGVPVAARYLGGHLSWLERWMTSGRVLVRYLQLVLAPVDVVGDYDFNTIPIAHPGDWDAWLGLLLLAGVIGLACFYRRRNWTVCLGLSVAVLALLPTSNWILPIGVLMSERLLYLPMVGVSVAVAVAFDALNNRRLRILLAVGGGATAFTLCFSHNYIWHNDFTFYRNLTRVAPDNAKGRLGYGFALLEAGRAGEAAEQLEAGLRIIPDNPALLTTLAMTKMTADSCSGAWPLLRRAEQINPEHADTLRRMADCLLRERRWAEAESAYTKALARIRFPDAQLLLNWGRVLENLDRRESAIEVYERAAALEPQNTAIRQWIAALRQR